MAKRKYAVLGATGHTGRVVVEELLGRGHEVRALGRDQVRLDTLVRLGAKPYPVDLDHNVPALLEAFKGVDAVYALIPPNYSVLDYLKFEDRVGENIVEALKGAGVPYVVHLSSLGAELRSNTGPILGLHRQERRLDRIHDLHVLHLRPAYFMEEFLSWIPAIKAQDRVGCLFQVDLALQVIATADVAKKAVDYLDKLEFGETEVIELVGPHAYRMDDLVRIIGKGIGKPTLAYRQVDDETEEKALLARGFGPNPAALWIELEHAINEGRIAAHGQPYHGGITFERFVADTFVPAYKAV